MRTNSLSALHVTAFVMLFLFVLLPCAEAQPGEVSKEERAQAAKIAVQITDNIFGPDGQEQIKHTPPDQISVLRRVSVADPKNIKLHFALYFYEMLAENRKAALKEIEAAYNLSGKDPQYLMSYVLALKMNWQPIKARDLLASYSAEHGKPLEIEAQVAQFNVVIQEYAAALPVFQRWLKERSDAVPVEETTILLHQGTSQLYLGQTEKAIATLKKAIKAYPKNELAKGECSIAMVKSGDPKGALDFLEKEYRGHYAGEILYYKGVALEALGKGADAKSVYSKALKIGEEDLKISDDNGKDHFFLSLICGKLGLEEKAKSYKSNATLLHFTFEAPNSTNALKSPDPGK